jgi:anti-sigma B factor antagonist
MFGEGKPLSLSIEKEYRQDRDVWEVKISGEVDIYTSDKMKETLNRIVEEKNAEIQIDCKELSYIDSSGLGVLIGVLKKLKEEDKNLVVLNARSNIVKLLSITGLDKVFIIREN